MRGDKGVGLNRLYIYSQRKEGEIEKECGSLGPVRLSDYEGCTRFRQFKVTIGCSYFLITPSVQA
jgi:hypothetical protein